MPIRHALWVIIHVAQYISITMASILNPITMSPSSSDCAALALILPGKVSFSGSPEYAARKSSYFTAFESEMSPICFVQPSNVDEVAKAVNQMRSSLLAGHTKVAIRSGGHTTWAGSANSLDGVTIDLSQLKTITIDPTTKVASIGVGNQWADVYSKLSSQKLAIVGGRVGKVGIGGLVIGGGLSYFSSQMGWVCDSVVNFEVVLSSGKIVQANATSKPDLFLAIKGGSNNFGIVTRIDFPTFSQGQMWGGTTVYDKSAYPELYKAFSDFASTTAPDDKAHIIVASVFIQGTGEVATTNLYYTKPIANPPALQPFTAIQPQYSTTLRTDSLLGLAEEQSSVSTNGQRQWFFTTSVRVDQQLMLDIHDLWLDTIATLQNEPGMVISLVFQPITKGLITNSLKRGGNSLGVDVSDGPFIIILLNTIHDNASSDHIVSTSILKLIEQIEALAIERQLGANYRFLNYAWKDQKVLESYGKDNIAKLNAASKKYDPEQFFQTTVPGGFKISKVAS